MSNLNDLPNAARLTAETSVLDFNARSIQSLVRERCWRELDRYGHIGAAPIAPLKAGPFVMAKGASALANGD